MDSNKKPIREIHIESIDALIEELEILRSSGVYIFRGQTNAFFNLIPSAFRQTTIKKWEEEFPVSPYQRDWYNSKEILNTIKLLTKQNQINEPILKLLKLNTYVMQYNYFLAKYISNNQDQFDDHTLENHRLRPAVYWAEKTTFENFFWHRLNQALTLTDVRFGSVLQAGSIEEILTGYDDSSALWRSNSSSRLDL